MDDKSELKVGDLVRRCNRHSAHLRSAGMVIGVVGARRLVANPAALVKWFDTTRGHSLWCFNQLQKVIKE